MKRKKLFACIGVVILMLSCACGCSQKQVECNAYTVLTWGTPEADAVWKRKSVVTGEILEDTTVIVNGVGYTGKYVYKFPSRPDDYNFNYCYVGEDCFIEIDVKTGQLRELSVYKIKDLEAGPADAAYCRQLADEIVGNYIALNKYQVRELQCYKCDLAHNYEFYKTVNGYEAIDGVEIRFFCNGELRSLKLNMPGSFDNVKSVKIDESKLKEVLEAKLRELVPTDLYELFKWKERHVHLIRLENGQCALYYRAIGVHYKNDTYGTTWEKNVDLLVIVEHTKKNPFKP